MSNIRETTLHLLQDATGRTLDLKVEQQPAPKPLTVIELKGDTKETFLKDLTEGSVVDWGDGTKSVVTPKAAYAKEVRHTYATASTANRVVTIDGGIDRGGNPNKSPFDTNALTAVRSLVGVSGEAAHLFYKCSSLSAIPAGLFDDNCTEAVQFTRSFYHCSSLSAVPTGLFDNCTAITDFIQCFEGCTSLAGETPYTMVDGKKVRLWERSPKNGFSKVYTRASCFNGCTKLSDYAEIPDDWK